MLRNELLLIERQIEFLSISYKQKVNCKVWMCQLCCAMECGPTRRQATSSWSCPTPTCATTASTTGRGRAGWRGGSSRTPAASATTTVTSQATSTSPPLAPASSHWPPVTSPPPPPPPHPPPDWPPSRGLFVLSFSVRNEYFVCLRHVSDNGEWGETVDLVVIILTLKDLLISSVEVTCYEKVRKYCKYFPALFYFV